MGSCSSPRFFRTEIWPPARDSLGGMRHRATDTSASFREIVLRFLGPRKDSISEASRQTSTRFGRAFQAGLHISYIRSRIHPSPILPKPLVRRQLHEGDVNSFGASEMRRTNPNHRSYRVAGGMTGRASLG